MKRTFLLIALLVFSGVMMAQNMVTNSSFENWTGGTPAGWAGAKSNIGASNIVQYTTNVHTGSAACQLINDGSSHKRFTTNALSVVAEQEYQITFWVRGAGEIRTGLYDATSGTSGYTDYNEYVTISSAQWEQYTQTIISGGTTNEAEFIFSVRNTLAANDHLQIDDVEITGGEVSISADFSADKTIAAPGTTIQFTDLSSGNPVEWEWTITGPETFTSTEQNPSFTFNLAGNYSVELTIGDGISEISSVSRDNYITIAYFLFNQDWNDMQWKGWTQVSVAGAQVWEISENYGIGDSPCAKMTGYSGAAYVNEDWLISPAFNLDANEGCVLSFYSAYKYNGNPLQVFFTNNYDGDPESADWQEIIFTPSTGNFTWTHSGNIDLQGFSGENCHIGFKYTSSDVEASTWELDDILLLTTTVAINEVETVDFQLSPNPCNGQFEVQMDENAQITVYNILGQLVHQQAVSGNTTIQLNQAAAGIYLIQIQNEKGNISTKKLIVR